MIFQEQTKYFNLNFMIAIKHKKLKKGVNFYFFFKSHFQEILFIETNESFYPCYIFHNTSLLFFQTISNIHVPESERTKLSFESFGANFEVTISYVSGPMSDKSSTSLSEISQGIKESVDEQASRFAMIDNGRNVKRVRSNTFFGFKDRYKI